MDHRTWHNRIPGWLLVTATVFVVLIFIVTTSYLAFQYFYDGRIYPGVTVAGVSLAGKTYEEARDELSRLATPLESGATVRFQDRTVIVGSHLAPLDPDADMLLLDFNPKGTAEAALAVGREGSIFSNVASQTSALLFGHDSGFSVIAEREAITALLKKTFSDFERPTANASVTLDESNKAVIGEEKNGVELEYDKATNRLVHQLSIGSRSEVQLTSVQTVPDIKKADVGNIQPAIDRLLAAGIATLKHEKKTWKIDAAIRRNWLELARDESGVTAVLGIDPIKKYLEKEVAPKIDQEPVEAKLELSGGRVSVWQAGKAGVTVDLDETARRLSAATATEPSDIDVATKVAENVVTDQSADELGLKEIIGTGTSQFAGSPANRRHNIRTGANALHGLLIKPGEEFSLLKALGEIDGKHGYLPELVIKGNKTIPEYGGGLCQIGTTVFRATFNSGLPVTQRRNHSYRVVYYEPAGTDATIYDPAPDYRFVNDTEHYILIQARIEGSTISFDFWGTKDSRKIEVGKPVIYNIVSPGPTKIIETPDLPEGQKKCTEKAHAGADAYFDYKVTYPDGEVKEKRFTSHYVPWQAVCLVGAKKAPENPGGGSTLPTSTITPAATPAVTPTANPAP